MTETNKPSGYEEQRGKQTIDSNEAFAINLKRERQFRYRIYWVVIIYLIVVLLNAAGVVALFVLNALGKIDVPYEYLTGWAIGCIFLTKPDTDSWPFRTVILA